MKSKNREISLGKHYLIIQNRYEAASALNDLLIAIWFLIGSFFFMNQSLAEEGTWLFIVGSAQLLIKPLIALFKLVHIGRIHRIRNDVLPHDR